MVGALQRRGRGHLAPPVMCEDAARSWPSVNQEESSAQNPPCWDSDLGLPASRGIPVCCLSSWAMVICCSSPGTEAGVTQQLLTTVLLDSLTLAVGARSGKKVGVCPESLVVSQSLWGVEDHFAITGACSGSAGSTCAPVVARLAMEEPVLPDDGGI